MEKLKKVIQQLNEKDFTQIKSALEKNNSEKFLHVLVCYNDNSVSDEEIREYINCSEGAFYVLKSRLLNKIQELLLETNNAHKPSLLQDGTTLTQYLYERPRETAITILQQLEKIYVNNDTPQELINVYSALKKTHYHSDKYYYYSQLYNKHIAYTVALEKAEDILLNFNRTLANYYFSRTKDDIELLLVLVKEIKNIYSLNQSHRFELIKNLILIQGQLFANIEHAEDEDAEVLIRRCEEIVEEYSEDKQIKYYALVVNYLWFEHYFKTNQTKKALHYFDVINKNSKTWLLLGNYCIAFKFMLTKPQLLYKLHRIEELQEDAVLHDNYDFYTGITLKFCKAIINIYHKNYGRSIDVLNELIRDISLHHFFHLEIEIKLTLAYLYIIQVKNEKADRILKSINRKIGTDRKDDYQNVLLFIKVLNLIMDENTVATAKVKIQKALEQFNLHNSSEKKILSFLLPEVTLYIKKL
ncbi:MAG TPA: hypothetical protein VKG26_04565 [Bacteroidia bacterium]|nr:hypothetical protein [Bacteroidia bacterium]